MEVETEGKAVDREVWATVVSGMESVAASEIRGKLPQPTSESLHWDRGRVFFTASARAARELKSINNLYSPVAKTELELEGGLEHRRSVFRSLAHSIDWEPALRAWEESYQRSLPGGLLLSLNASRMPHNSVPPSHYPDGIRPSFRVTCSRSGAKKQDFSSCEAASDFGAVVQEMFCWDVKMKDFDVEVILDINVTQVQVSVALTLCSLGNRNLVHFGPTALRAAHAFLLCQLADPQPGETLLDPCCGGGSIPIEAAREWPLLKVLAGDNHSVGVKYAAGNLAANSPYCVGVGLLQWDARRLPLEADSVDVVVCDLPFGKRIGSKTDNRTLYPALLQDWARVVRGGGRAVLLTADRRSAQSTLRSLAHLWRIQEIRTINQGGIPAAVISLRRLHSNSHGASEEPLLEQQN